MVAFTHATIECAKLHGPRSKIISQAIRFKPVRWMQDL